LVKVAHNERRKITMATEDTLQERLAQIARNGTPKVASFARWLIENLHSVAFSSVRSLAREAETNPNTVTRLAQALGYDGFDALRSEVRAAVSPAASRYGDRAQALRNRTDTEIWTEALHTTQQNIERFFTPNGLKKLEACVDPLLNARRVHAIGVRSCLSIAHYFSYAGGMAFDNFAEFPSMPGSIMDHMSRTSDEDIVVAITYEHYSVEVVRACQVARARGARILAITDSYTAPIAEGAWQVWQIPMAGPQLMPSLSTAFAAVEFLLTAMAARSSKAAENITTHENRIREYGGYISVDDSTAKKPRFR
jgi:DNA-binding MurR/RpiR family transcriptional regulator